MFALNNSGNFALREFSGEKPLSALGVSESVDYLPCRVLDDTLVSLPDRLTNWLAGQASPGHCIGLVHVCCVIQFLVVVEVNFFLN